MKFIVTSAIVYVAATNALAANVVDCSRPPGGQVECPDGLTAMCNVKSGVVYAKCIQLSPAPKDKQLLFQKMFEGAGSGYVKPLNSNEIDRALLTGEVTNPSDGTVVRFSLPPEYKSMYTPFMKWPQKERK